MITLCVFLALALSVFPINSQPTLPESECTNKNLSICVFQTDLGTIDEPDSDKVLAAFVRLNRIRLPAELRKLNQKDKLLRAVPFSNAVKTTVIEPLITGYTKGYEGFVIVYFNGGKAPAPDNSKYTVRYTCEENNDKWNGKTFLTINEIPNLKLQITLKPAKIDKEAILNAFWEANKNLPCDLKDILDIGKIDVSKKLVDVFVPNSSKYGGSVKVSYSLSRT